MEVSHRGRRANYYYTRMLGPKSSMERCRERRRRRIEMRRNSALAAAAAANGGVVPWRKRSGGVPVGEGSQPGGGSTVMGFPVPADEFAWGPGNGGVVVREGGSAGVGGMLAVPDVAAGRRRGVPVVGAVAVAGRQRDMEDAVTIRIGLCTPAINRCRPVHFFGVFDGHGGPHVAIMCKDKMHEIMEEEIMRAEYPVTPRPHQKVPTRSRAAAARLPPGMTADESVLQEAWRRVLTRAFFKTEMVALHTCGCGSVGFNCTCDRSVVAYSGSTAVAVVLTDEHVVVANCGDSRAVMYRGGRVIPLSFDHKPDRADEKVRVEASGGRVFGADTPRVEGILAMSRAIGDRFLKPYVISEPEVTFTRRDAEDEFLIMASDGLWDVMSPAMTCRVARQCLKDPRADVAVGGSRGFNIGPPLENDGPGTVFPSRSASAAALLTRLALARRSGDNICVVVVDLKRATVG